ELEGDEVTDESEVEELRELAFALGPDLFDAGDDFVQHRQRHLEATGDLRVLELVPQVDEGEDLPRDVAMLTPTLHLVVAELGMRVPERRRVRVLVHLRLPAGRRHRADVAAAVDERDRATDALGDDLGHAAVGRELVATLAQLLDGE